MRRRSITAGVTSLVLIGTMAATAAAAGPSTPNGAVAAWDPGEEGAPWRMALVARADAAGVPSALVRLQVAGMTVTGYEVHRVAVGETACEGPGGGHDEGTGDDQGAGGGEGVRAAVRGVAVLSVGTDVLPVGSKVQVWIDLRDVGKTPYGDRARVRVRPAPHQGEPAADEEGESCGGEREWTFDSQWQPISQVVIYVPPPAPTPPPSSSAQPPTTTAALPRPSVAVRDARCARFPRIIRATTTKMVRARKASHTAGSFRARKAAAARVRALDLQRTRYRSAYRALCPR